MDLFPKKKDGPEIIEETIGQFTSIVSKLQQGTQNCEERVVENDATIEKLKAENRKYKDSADKAQSLVQGIEMLLSGGIPDETPRSTDESEGA